MENVSTKDKEYILHIIKTLTFNITDCIGLLKYYDQPDSKREIVRDTLQIDLELLMKLEDFIKGKSDKED